MRAYKHSRGLLDIGMTMVLAAAGCGGDMSGICADCDASAPQSIGSEQDAGSAGTQASEPSEGAQDAEGSVSASDEDGGALGALEADAATQGSAEELPSGGPAVADVDASLPVSAAQPPAGGPSAGDATSEAAACSLSGAYAMQVTFKLRWANRDFASLVPSVRGGEGEFGFKLLANVEAAVDGTRMVLHPCQATLPELRSNLTNDRYGLYFADAVWDSLSMPSFNMTATACTAPGCKLTQPYTAGLIGAALPRPDAPWPATLETGSWPDHDGDRLPGITAEVRAPAAGPQYAYLPIDALGSAVAHTLGLGLRVGYGLRAMRTDCNGFSGDVVDGVLDWQAVSCLSTSKSVDCNQDLWFVNENLPQFTVVSGVVSASRLPEPADCRAVRAVLAPSR
ncbi:MAG: hypothetical protein RL385_4983 [Pseudomonadota bacterium]|jgi:hypothetical protein